MLQGVLALVMVGCCLLQGCGEAVGPAPASGTPASTRGVDGQLVEVIAQMTYRTSPPAHPSLPWAELAPQIEAARRQVVGLPELTKPTLAADPLAERMTSRQVAALADARRRAMVLRAESARLLAAGDPDGAAVELENVLRLAATLSTWGMPTAAEASAETIELVLDAMEQPEAAAMTLALTGASRARLRAALERLNTDDPAGRLRALTETTASRVEAMRERAVGADGPTAVRGVAGRYVPGATLGTTEDIDRLTREAFAFSRALADGWARPSRSAITMRLRQRQADDGTGVLAVLLAGVPDACDGDAGLRERIAREIEGLR